jgi:hypothetical protein
LIRSRFPSTFTETGRLEKSLLVAFIIGTCPPSAAWCDQPVRFQDKVCGPRCAQFVLSHFGQEEDLVALVQEIQWPDLEGGCSIEAIQECLSARGLYTSCVTLTDDVVPFSPHPVIAHHPPSEGSLGHFSVLMPAGEGENAITVWDGIAGYAVTDMKTWRASCSGVVLFASDNSINVDELLHPIETRVWYGMPLFFATMAFFLPWLFLVGMKRRLR